jgi:hypothetical protein
MKNEISAGRALRGFYAAMALFIRCNAKIRILEAMKRLLSSHLALGSIEVSDCSAAVGFRLLL